jgi:Mg-chelatase subunit ChlD
LEVKTHQPKTKQAIHRQAILRQPKTKQTKQSITQSYVATVGCTQRDLFLVLDMSGSMSGRGLENLQTCTKDIVSSVVKSGDQLEITTFADVVHPPVLPLAELDTKRFEQVVDALQPSGRTALWQAVITAVERAGQVHQQGTRFVEVVLMTDGDDTSGSSELFELARARVAKPGIVFKFFVISCGSSESTRQQLVQLCEPAHCKLFIEDNVSGLREAFGKVKRELRSVTLTKTTRLVEKVHFKTQVRRKRLH